MSTIKTNTISNVAGTKSVPTDTVVDGSAKAWVNFNGTGVVAIRQAFNVSSITDNATGDYTVNFATPLPTANYVSALAARSAGGPVLAIPQDTITPRTTSAYRMGCVIRVSPNWADNDPAFVDATFFGT